MISNTVVKFNSSSSPVPLNYHTERPRVHHIGPHFAINQNYSSIGPQPSHITFNQYQPPTFHRQQQQVNTLTPQLRSAVSFGNNPQTLPIQPIRISFNQHGYKSASFQSGSFPEQLQPHNRQHYPVIGNNQQSKRPQLIENPSKLLRETRSSRNLKGEVKTFNVDTTDLKTLKQNEFIGCFHCFSPVTYDTQKNKIC